MKKLSLLLLFMTIFLAGCALNMPPAADLIPPTPTSSQEAIAVQTEAEVSNLTPEQQAILAQLQNYGPAPELTNDTWLNSEPLQLADLRGNVVIVEFWTFG